MPIFGGQFTRALLALLAMGLTSGVASSAVPQGKVAVDLAIGLDPGNPDPVLPDGLVTWNTRVTNISTQISVSPGLMRIDFGGSSVPPSVDFFASGSNWSCSTNSCLYNSGLEPGQISTDLTITTTAPTPTQGNGQIDLMVSTGLLSGFVFDPNPTNNNAADQVEVTGIGADDFYIDSLTASPNPVGLGGAVTFTLVAGNDAPIASRGFSFSMDYALSSIPSGGSLTAPPTGTGWNCDSSSCDYVLQILPGALSNPLTFNAIAPTQPGTMTLDAMITSDGSPGNNSAQAVVTVAAPPPLDDFRISSVAGTPNPIDAGANGSFEVRIERFGIPRGGEEVAGGGPSLTYSLNSIPGGAQVIGVPTGSGWSCSGGSCDYSLSLPFNTPSEPLLFAVQAPPNGPGSMTLDVLLADDANNNNNSGSATLAVNGDSLDYVFSTFSATPSPVINGNVIDFQIAVTQSGPTRSGLSFNYSLSATPGSAQALGTPVGSNWSCDSSSCNYNGTLTDGQTTPAVQFSARAPQIAPGTVTLAATLFGDDDSSNNDGSVEVPVVVEDPPPPVQLSLDKSAPGTAQIDQSFVYTLTVNNTGMVPATQLSVVDNLPSGISLLGVEAPNWNCQTSATSVSCARELLSPGQQTQILISVSASEAGDYLNEALLGASELSGTLSDSALTRVLGETEPFVDLQLTKTDSMDPVAPGAAFSYQLLVRNVGNRPASGVTIDDTLPAGLTLISAAGPGWTCSGSLQCVLANPLLGGQSSSVTVQVLAPNATGTITNRAQVSSTEVEETPSDNLASQDTTILGETNPVADLSVSAAAGSELTPGQVPRPIIVTLRNLGPDNAVALQLTGTANGPIRIVDAAGPMASCTVSGTTVNCTLTALSANATTSVAVPVEATASSGSPSVRFDLSAQTSDPQLGNNTSQVNFTINQAGADLAVALSDSADPVMQGGSFSYQLTLTNNGPAAADAATLMLNLDPSLNVTSQSTPGLNCAPAGSTTQTCSLSAPLLNNAILSASFNVQVPLDAAESLSATVNVTSALDPNSINNSDSESTAVNAADEETINDELDEATAGNPIANSAVDPVAEQCANPDPSFVEFCNDLLGASDAEINEALAALAPDENLGQAVVMREVSFAQFFNVDARLAELRGGGGGFSSAGLNLSTGTGSLGFNQLSEALQGDARQVDDAGGLLSSPWGFFVNGTIGSGDQSFDGSSGQVGVDFDSRGLTAGVDYRYSSTLVFGAALGYASFDSDITGDSQLDTTGYILTGYGSWYPRESFYIDGRISIGTIDLEQTRRVRFTLNGQTTDLQARGNSDADQISLAFGTGYHINRGAWNFTPNASIRYTDSDIDGFTETGANQFSLTYDSSSTDSLLISGGSMISRAFSMSRGVITPQLSLSWNYEDRGDELAVTGRFTSTNGSEVFRLVNPDADSSYGAVGLGFVFVGANGVQAYLNYRSVFGYDDFDRDTINLGARFEF